MPGAGAGALCFSVSVKPEQTAPEHIYLAAAQEILTAALPAQRTEAMVARAYLLFLISFLFAFPAFAEWEEWQTSLVIHEAEFTGSTEISWDEGRCTFNLTSEDGSVLSSSCTLQNAGGGAWIIRTMYADCVIDIFRDGNVITAQRVVQCAASVSDIRLTK